jgi:hypothetical protein
MNVHVFLLVFLLLFSSFAAVCRLLAPSWFGPVQSRGLGAHDASSSAASPRTPDDCPVCRHASTASLGAGPVPAPIRPWSEVKSRRGAPKRIDTQGFACPNQQCLYFGITDADIHALVGDGKHGRTEPIQTFRGPACRTRFGARRDTPLYHLKTPSQQVAMVLSALAEGLDASSAERVFGFRQATITTWLTRALEHAQTLHERFFCHLHLPHLQLDELRTRLRCAKQILWLWLAIDPLTRDSAGASARSPHTEHGTYSYPLLATDPGPWLHSPLHQRWIKFVLLCSHRPFWTLAPGESPRPERPPVAGGSGPDLRTGEKMLSAAQARKSQARHASWNRGRSHSRLTGDGPLRAAEHRFHRAGESDHPPWNSHSGPPYLGHRTAVSPAAGPSGVVACLLARMSRPHQALRVALVQPSERSGRLLAPRYRHRTPAMAAGRTNRRWTVGEVLTYPLLPVSS